MPPHEPTSESQENAIRDVLACFDVFARIRTARDSILHSSRLGPRDEQRAFEDLQRAVTTLRAIASKGS